MEWPQFHDGRGFSGELALSFGVDSLPRTFLIDPRGRIVASDLRGDHLEAAVSSLLSLSRKSSPAAQLD